MNLKIVSPVGWPPTYLLCLGQGSSNAKVKLWKFGDVNITLNFYSYYCYVLMQLNIYTEFYILVIKSVFILPV